MEVRNYSVNDDIVEVTINATVNEWEELNQHFKTAIPAQTKGLIDNVKKIYNKKEEITLTDTIKDDIKTFQSVYCQRRFQVSPLWKEFCKWCEGSLRI